MAKSKRPIEVEVETTVVVMAFDETSARKKAALTFRAGRPLSHDVEGTGKTFVYDATRLPKQPRQRRRDTA